VPPEPARRIDSGWPLAGAEAALAVQANDVPPAGVRPVTGEHQPLLVCRQIEDAVAAGRGLRRIPVERRHPVGMRDVEGVMAGVADDDAAFARV